jgi:hypothetical protein
MRIIVYLTSHHRIVSHTLLILSQMERYVYFAEKLIRISIASDTAHNKIYIYIYIYILPVLLYRNQLVLSKRHNYKGNLLRNITILYLQHCTSAVASSGKKEYRAQMICQSGESCLPSEQE